MSAEAFKQQARQHEQKEEWKKALELYRKAAAALAQDDRPDVALLNRIGDLCVRVGDLEQATTHYEQAVELYLDAGLPNNAIAVCRKIIRHAPHRHQIHLKMGRIRAGQRFLPDARESFFTYAERMRAAGDREAALRALQELAEEFPDDVEALLALADALGQVGRSEEALPHLTSAHRILQERGDFERAREVEERIRAIDASRLPGGAEEGIELTLGAAPPKAPASPEPVFELEGGLEFAPPLSLPELEVTEEGEPLQEIDLGVGFDIAADSESIDPEAVERLHGLEDVRQFLTGGEEDRERLLDPFAELELERGEDPGAEPSLPAEEPTFSLPDPEAPPEPQLLEELEAEPKEWGWGIDPREAVFGDEGPLPALPEPDLEPLTRWELPPLPSGEVGGDAPAAAPSSPAEAPASDAVDRRILAGDLAGAEQVLRARMAEEPDEVAHRQRLVELAFARGDVRARAEAYTELALCLERNGSTAEAARIYEQVLQLDPDNPLAQAALRQAQEGAAVEPRGVAASEDYVDLASLVFGAEDEEKSTRFKVAYPQPSGDEKADFAHMLTQFRAKVAQNLDEDDLRAHHDLGTAYKEMGLLDEAVEQFQAALRVAPDHLPTYELLGQCLLEKGEPAAAVHSLERALGVRVEVEDELLAIYYFLGRAYQDTGNEEAAVEFYDRVVSLDTEFKDVAERLRALR